MNRTIIYCIVFLTTLCTVSEAQVLKGLGKTLKNKAGGAIRNDNDENVVVKAAINALRKSYAKKDSTSMNLALSSYDNVAFYSDRKGSENVLRYTSTLLTQMGGYRFSREDEGKSTMEMMGVSNPFKKKNSKPAAANSYASLTDEQYQLLKQAETLNQTGEISYSSRLYDYAKASFVSASFTLGLDERLNNSILHAKVKSNLGMLFQSVGDFVQSEQYFEEALDILSSPDHENQYLLAVIGNNQAILLKDLGKFNQAERQLKSSIKTFEEMGEAGMKATLISKNNLAILYQYLGRTGEAIRLLQEVTQNADDWGEKSNSYQRVSINLALIYESTGDYDKAEEIYLNSLEIKKRQRRTNQPDYASILTNLSALYVNTDNTDKDIAAMLEEARKIYTSQYDEKHPTLITVNSVEMAYLLQKGDFAKAEEIATANKRLTDEVYGEEHPKSNKATIDLAIALWRNGKSDEALANFILAMDRNIDYIQNYFPAMSEVEKSKYWQTLQPDFHAFYAFVFENPAIASLRQVLDYEIVTKGILLSTSGKIRKQILASGDEKLIKNYNDWKSAKNQLAYYYSVSKEELEKQQIDLDSIAEAANEKERWLSANAESFGTEKEKADPATQLAAGEALIDIIKYYDLKKEGYFYNALVLTKDKISSVPLASAESLDSRGVKLYKNSILYKQSESRSYSAFWEPLMAHLQGKSKIYLIKDGAYNQVSIGSLYNGKTYLSELYDLSVLTNPSDLAQVRNEPLKTRKMFLMGSPDFDLSKFSALPGTLTEVNTIAGIAARNNLNTSKYLKNEATEANFSKSTDADVLHVATHGFFIENKNSGNKSAGEVILTSNMLDALMRSGIVLSGENQENSSDLTQTDDGLVTAYEISTLDFPSTEIVVLSACETGLGEIKTGEGVYGLQRSFLVAGARSVIMSLWKVDDGATRDFMIGFYSNWLSSGDKHDAFNKARRQLKAKYPEPYYWGAFVLIEG